MNWMCIGLKWAFGVTDLAVLWPLQTFCVRVSISIAIEWTQQKHNANFRCITKNNLLKANLLPDSTNWWMMKDEWWIVEKKSVEFYAHLVNKLVFHWIVSTFYVEITVFFTLSPSIEWMKIGHIVSSRLDFPFHIVKLVFHASST